MLRANENETVWIVTGFGVHGRVTNTGKTNYIEEIYVAKLNGREMETAKPAIPRTDLVTSPKPILLLDPSYLLDPAL
jgi:hypothetical protein